MHKGRKRRKNKKLYFVIFIILMCLMSAGYAAFNTNITLSAKGNIVSPDKCFTVTDNGDGTGTIASYDLNCGPEVVVPTKIKNLAITKTKNCCDNSGCERVFPNGVTSVTFQDPFETLGTCTFRENTELKKVVFPSSLRVISSHAIWWSGLEEIYLPEGVEEIGAAAFEGNNLTSLKIPNSVKNITVDIAALNLLEGEYSFRYYRENGVENKSYLIGYGNRNDPDVINIPEGITEIAAWAFQGTGGKTINFPSTITTIHDYIFGAPCPAGMVLNIDRAKDAVSGAPWHCDGLVVNWTGDN